MKFRESNLAHKYLDGLQGIEIGGSAHNAFGLNTLNVDKELVSAFKDEEEKLCGERRKIDVVAEGDVLPFADATFDFVLSSHVLEHFFDPIKAIWEWMRVVKDEGLVFAIIPHKERTFDMYRRCTSLAELWQRHTTSTQKAEAVQGHYSVWITQDIIELVRYFDWDLLEVQDPDDKVGNGFTIVLRVHK